YLALICDYRFININYKKLFFFSSRRRHTRSKRDWSSDVCSSDLRVQGPVPTEDARWLLSSASHTATTPEILGGTGLALFVLVVCLYATEYLPRLLSPLVAAGTMALTIYVLHALALAWKTDLGLYPSDG